MDILCGWPGGGGGGGILAPLPMLEMDAIELR